MDTKKIRQDIPLTGGVIYLDNASTSLSPRPVIDAMLEYETHYRANVGRGVHRLSQIAGQLYWDAHETVNSFIGGKRGTPVFVRNCTEAINMVARGLSFQEGDEVITTVSDHHSNLLPWYALREQGVIVKVIAPSGDAMVSGVTGDDIADAVTPGTRLIAISQASNVLGNINPVKEITSIAHDADALCLVDGAQSVPHMKTDVQDLGCDFLCFSGHKMLGPTGTGVLWMREESLEPLLLGGGMIDEVSTDGYRVTSGYQKYEAGTPNISGVLGLRAAVQYLSHIGMEDVAAHESALTCELMAGLSDIGVRVIGPPFGENRIGVVSFTVDGMHPHDVAHLLDDQCTIITRSGHHCCMPLMQHLGLPDGTVRASMYLYNTGEEIQTLVSGLREIIEGV